MSTSRESAENAPDETGTQYRVTGPQAVHDTRPGDTFTAQLDPGQEAFLLMVGHIEIVEPTPDGDTATGDSDSDDQAGV